MTTERKSSVCVLALLGLAALELGCGDDSELPGGAGGVSAAGSGASSGEGGTGGTGGTGGNGCPEDQVLCEGACINPTTSRDYCGAAGDCLGQNAGDVCDATESCYGGSCEATIAGDEPVLTPIGYKTVWAEHELTFTVNATDPQNDPLTFEANGGPSGAEFDVSTRTFSWTPTVDQVGDHEVEIRVSDGGGSDWERVVIRVLAGGPRGACTLIVPDTHDTIQAAVDAGGSGDVVCVRGGTYRETVTIRNGGASNDPLVLQAHPGDEGQVILDASDPVTGWTDVGSSIYRAAVSDPVRQLFKDDKPLSRSRYPATGYLFPTSVDSGSTSIIDTNLPGDDDTWIGANIHILTQYWDINHQTVTDFDGSSGRLTFTELDRSQTAREIFGYYLTNIVEEIDADGEWAYADGNVYLMSTGGSPTSITRSARDNVVRVDSGPVEVYGFVVRYADGNAIVVTSSSGDDIVIADNRIVYSFGNAITSRDGGSRHRIVRNSIHAAGNHGIYVNAVNDSLVAYNDVSAVGAEELGDDIYIGQGTGIEVVTSGGTGIIGNRVDGAAYCGILVVNWWVGHDREIAHNHITNTMLSLDDGGGIYVMTGHTGDEPPDGWDTIHHNVIEDSFGYYEGTPRAGQPRESNSQSVGIYVDSTTSAPSHRTRVTDNVAVGNHSAGIFSHDSLRFEAFDNTLFDNKKCQMLVTNDDDPGAGDAGEGNILFATTTSQATLQARGAPELGEWNHNVFYGGGGAQHIAHKDEGSYQYYSLDEWRALSGEEAEGVELTLTGQPRIFVNPTLNTVLVGLQGESYVDLDGNPMDGAFTLEPFESRILVEN